MARQTWNAVLRAFGMGNLLVAGLALLHFLVRDMLDPVYPVRGETVPTFVEPLRWALWTLNLIFLGVFTVAGRNLLALKLSAVGVLNKLFAVEATFLLGGVCLAFVMGVWSVGGSIILLRVWIPWNFAIWPQLLSGYALIAAILLNVASKKLA